MPKRSAINFASVDFDQRILFATVTAPLTCVGSTGSQKLGCCVLADGRPLMSPCPSVAWQTSRQRYLLPSARAGGACGHRGSTPARVPALAGDTLPRWF